MAKGKEGASPAPTTLVTALTRALGSYVNQREQQDAFHQKNGDAIRAYVGPKVDSFVKYFDETAKANTKSGNTGPWL